MKQKPRCELGLTSRLKQRRVLHTDVHRGSSLYKSYFISWPAEPWMYFKTLSQYISQLYEFCITRLNLNTAISLAQDLVGGTRPWIQPAATPHSSDVTLPMATASNVDHPKMAEEEKATGVSAIPKLVIVFLSNVKHKHSARWSESMKLSEESQVWIQLSCCTR